IGWILGYLRKGIVHRDYRDYAGLLPEGSARGSTHAVLPGTSSRGRSRSEIYVGHGPRLQSMMLGKVICAGWRCVTFDGAANGCFRTRSDCPSAEAAEPVSRYSPGIFRGGPAQGGVGWWLEVRQLRNGV